MIDGEDPGWPLRSILLMAVPGLGLLRAERRVRAGGDGLVHLRQIFAGYCLGVVAMGIVVWILDPAELTDDPSPRLAAALLVAGLVAHVIGRLVERPLVCSAERELVASYRKRFFLRIALADAAALLGFVGALTTGQWWVYPGSVVISALGFSRAAPTRWQLARDQDTVTQSGCRYSLTRALQEHGMTPKG